MGSWSLNRRISPSICPSPVCGIGPLTRTGGGGGGGRGGGVCTARGINISRAIRCLIVFWRHRNPGRGSTSRQPKLSARENNATENNKDCRIQPIFHERRYLTIVINVGIDGLLRHKRGNAAATIRSSSPHCERLKRNRGIDCRVIVACITGRNDQVQRDADRMVHRIRAVH